LVPEDHLRASSPTSSRGLELSSIYASYEEERGFPPYDPRLMAKLLIYGYATGTPSSRKLEERTHSDVARCGLLCADQHPGTARSRACAAATFKRWRRCLCKRCASAARRGS
jgi:hypothetical protein